MKAKKLILIGFLLLCLNSLYCIRIHGTIVSAETTAHTHRSAEATAQVSFRRNLLEFLTSEYENSLKEYFHYWRDSRQMIDRNLLDTLISLSNSLTVPNWDDGQYLVRIDLLKEDLNNHLSAERERNQSRAEDFYNRFQRDGRIENLLQSIDLMLLYYDENVKERIDELVRLLKDLRMDYPSRHLVYKEETISIPFETPSSITTDISFRFEDQTQIKAADRNNRLNLIVGFNSSNVQHDITIDVGTRNTNFVIKYDFNIPATFRTSRLTHVQFLYRLLNEYFDNKSGEITIFYIPDSRFIVRSNNFSAGIGHIKEILRQKEWIVAESAAPNEYTHVIEINKVITDERRLNIGAYYLKGYLEMRVFDNERSLLQMSRTRELEALDNSSMTSNHARLDRLLIREIESLF